jgi:hypothetical protein
MDIQAEKATIIKQFMQKEQPDDEVEIPEPHKEIVRRRIKEYENSAGSYLTLEQIEDRILSKK